MKIMAERGCTTAGVGWRVMQKIKHRRHIVSVRVGCRWVLTLGTCAAEVSDDKLIGRSSAHTNGGERS